MRGIFLLGVAFALPVPSPPCDFSLEVVFLQDASHSYKDDIPQLKAQLPLLLDSISVAYPESRFSYHSFVDKPIAPFGWPNDVCFKDLVAFTHDSSKFDAAIDKLKPGGGNDHPEGILAAIQHAALSPDIGWTVNKRTPNGRPIARVIIAMTDAPYHQEGDGHAEGLYPNDGDAYLDCKGEDYPSVEQVKDALETGEIFSAFLVAEDPKIPNLKIVEEYKMLAERLHGIDGVAVEDIESDARKFSDGLREILTKIDRRLCPSTQGKSSTTPTPTPPPVGFCPVTFEIAFQVDCSHSNAKNVEIAQEQIGDVFDRLQAKYPGTVGALVSHSDKPIAPFGYEISMDYCYYLHNAMTENADELKAGVKTLRKHSGNDWWEAQIESGMHAALSKDVGWSGKDFKHVNGELVQVQRVLVVLTDAGYHTAGDGRDYGLSPNDGDEVLNCRAEDYPSELQFAEALQKTDTAALFWVPAGITPLHLDPVPRYAALGVLLRDHSVVSAVIDFEADPAKIVELISEAFDGLCVEVILQPPA